MARSFFAIGDLVEIINSGNKKTKDVGLIVAMEKVLGLDVADILWSDGVIMQCSTNALSKIRY